MTYFVWLNVLVILCLAILSTRNGATVLINKCRKDVDCNVNLQTCHSLFKICVRKKAYPIVFGKSNKNTTCKCLVNEYCHPIFARCLPILTPPSTRNSKKPTAPDCKSDRNCTKNKYCHKTFKKCLDFLAIPTVSPTTSSTQSCKNDSSCAKNQYCHGFFRICLVRPTVFQNSTTPRPKYGCTTDTDCHPGQYCQNTTNNCQQVKSLSGSGVPSPPKRHNKCKTDSDCRKNEFCQLLLGQRNSVTADKKQLMKCSSVLRCSQIRRRHTSLGVCITEMVEFHPPIFKCSRDEDCGAGMCCLTRLGMCKGVSTRGDLCVTQAADFICPCSANTFCRPNFKNRKLKGKRLERKLKIPRYIRKALITRGLVNHKKYIYGKCHKVAM